LYSFYEEYANTVHGSSVKYFADKLIYKAVRGNSAEYTTREQTLGNIIAFTRYNINNGDLLNDYSDNYNIFAEHDKLFMGNISDTIGDTAGSGNYVAKWTAGGLNIEQTDVTSNDFAKTLLLYENIYYILNDNAEKPSHLTTGTNLTKIIPSTNNDYKFGDEFNYINELSDLIGITVTTKNGIKSAYEKNNNYVTVQTAKSELIDMTLEYYLPKTITNNEDLPDNIAVTTGFAIKTNPLAAPSFYSFTINVQRTASAAQ